MTVVVRRDDKLYNYNFAVIERPQNPASAAAPIAGSPTLTNHVATSPH
jgi:hypothetical protein